MAAPQRGRGRAGSRPAIAEQPERVRTTAGIEVDVDLRGLEADRPEDVQIALYRAV